jgi:hypothetical protein
MPSSGGLSRFTGPESNISPLQIESNDERSLRGAAAKVKIKDRKSVASSTPRKHIGSNNTFPPTSNNHNDYGDPYAQHELQTTSARDVFEDSTIASNFDETISTVHMDAPQFHNDHHAYQHGGNGQEEYGEAFDDDETAHQNLGIDTYGKTSALPLNHKESQQFFKSEHQANQPRQQSRFKEPLQHRSASPATAPRKVSRKREHKNERQHHHLPAIEQQHQPQFPQQEYGEQMVHAFQRPLGFDAYGDQDIQGHLPPSEGGFEPNPSSRLGSPIHQPLPQNIEGGMASKEEQATSDYTDEELKRKRYTDLKDEEWGACMPRYQLPAHFPDELRGPNITVEQKLEMFRSVKVENEEEILRSDREQEAFFEHLSDEDWEVAGQYIRHKMEESMNNMKSAREKKREITARYEKMYEERENMIQRKASLIQSQLAHIQNQGSSMFQGMLVPSRAGGSSRGSSRT